jgi:hypothetical protein
MKLKFFKTTALDMAPCHGGHGKYDLHVWTDRTDPVPCTSGYHVCEEKDLLDWLAPRVFSVETNGKIVHSQHKVVCESIRLVRELPYDTGGWVEWLLSRLPLGHSKTIAEANQENDMTGVFCALAREAAKQGPEVSVQITSKRVAQAVAFAAYGASIEAAWDLSGGEGPASYWKDAEAEAQAAKALAHDAERTTQSAHLMKLLGIESTAPEGE